MSSSSIAWHLVAGPTGAGKTTYARQLAGTLHGLSFSIDEWMNTLFWRDSPEKNDLPWALERIGRCEDQVAVVATQLLSRGVPAILDMGLTTRSLRERWFVRAQAAGAPLVLHILDLPAEIRWARVEARNYAQEKTFVFPVTRTMFDLVETMWESPSSTECAHYRETFWLSDKHLAPTGSVPESIDL